MQLIYITGVEGSGKSTVCEYLAAKGYRAIDVDKEELSRRYRKHTWEPTDNLPSSSKSSYNWYDEREWKIKPVELIKLRNDSEADNLFICGIVENFEDVRQAVDKIICLTLPAEVVSKRLKTRKNNTFGKNKAEFEYIIKKHRAYEAMNEKVGSIMIDASRPLQVVIKDILEQV